MGGEEDDEFPPPPRLKLQRTASFPGADPPPLPADPSLQPDRGGMARFLSFGKPKPKGPKKPGLLGGRSKGDPSVAVAGGDLQASDLTFDIESSSSKPPAAGSTAAAVPGAEQPGAADAPAAPSDTDATLAMQLVPVGGGPPFVVPQAGDPPLAIGRSPSNGVVLEDTERAKPAVSGEHARLLRQPDGSLALQVLSTSAFTFVNEAPHIAKPGEGEVAHSLVTLRSGDVLRFGGGKKAETRYDRFVYRVQDAPLPGGGTPTTDLSDLSMQKQALDTAAVGGMARGGSTSSAASQPAPAPRREMGGDAFGAPLQTSLTSGEATSHLESDAMAPPLGLQLESSAVSASLSTDAAGGAVGTDAALESAQQMMLSVPGATPLVERDLGAADPGGTDISLSMDRSAIDTADTAGRGTGAMVSADDDFDGAEQAALVRYINTVLREEAPAAALQGTHLGAVLPLPPGGDALFEAAARGVLLAQFLACVDAEALDARALNAPDARGALPDAARLQNHTLCTNAATAIGAGVAELTPEMLLDATAHKQPVLELAWNLARQKLLGRLTPKATPELLQLLDDDEQAAALGGNNAVETDDLMVRWLNHHVGAYLHANPEQAVLPADFEVTNLHADLADSAALAVVLHQLAPEQCQLDTLVLKSHEKRAARMLADARTALGVPFEITPADVCAPRERLLTAFVGSLMSTRLGLPKHEKEFTLAELNLALGDTGDESEQLQFRNWIASLGLGRGLHADWLAEDCRDGLLLLRIEDKLAPGAVDWSRVSLKPRSVFQRTENCNYALQLARRLGLRTVGIAGQDIAAGNRKLTTAIIWQLMRASVLRFLSELSMDEQDIRTWANRRVAAAAADGAAPMNIASFKDSKLQTGVFVLRLLGAVAPECVEAAEVRDGATAQECGLNAKYAISCAHKMGCTVFTSWRDIVEVQPRMVLCLLAAAMQVDMRRQHLSGDQLLEQLHGDSVVATGANVLSF